jgi:hypothetical protein
MRSKRKTRKGNTRARKGEQAPPKILTPRRRELQIDGLRAILARVKLDEADREQLSAAIETLAFITHELDQSAVTIARLRRLLFGPSSEKTRDVLNAEEATESAGAEAVESCNETTAEAAADDVAARGKAKKGHGRNGAAAYKAARRVVVEHDTLAHGDQCPGCKGKVYRLPAPALNVRVQAVAPLAATVYERERLRCNLCGEVSTASPPPGVGEKKYDETAAAMIALLKYGCGLPFNRLERLGANLGIPLPSATQWDVVSEAAEACVPVWAELVQHAADGDVVYIDDTKMNILSVAKQIEKERAAGCGDRTGIFTSGVISTVEDRQIAVFFTGREHAGENLTKVLAQRSAALPLPIQMGDALSRNTSPGVFETILGKCLTHGRRQFVDVIGAFPSEVKRVLETLRDVYRHDAATRENRMSPEERLAYHQEHSRPLMEELKAWLDSLVADKKVEPNSSLGAAIQYFDNHWDGLTLFLRVPGAPLDNNICERGLKRVIMHRKNSLFFKTENGAQVGDMFLSLIHTAELCGANPFEYLVAIQRNRDAVAEDPAGWMPWSYDDTLERLRSSDFAPGSSP